jgi:anti-sigma factor RsiW
MSDHREIRELLGSYVLGHGSAEERLAVQAHLDGCGACRTELAELEPLVGALERVVLDHLDDAPAPPPGLGDAIFEAIRAEQELVDARTARAAPRRGRVGLMVAALSTAAALVVGLALGWQLSPAPADLPREPVAVRSLDVDVEVLEADVIPHTWGLEIQVEAKGFDDGATYRAAVVDADGQLRPAGEFIGIGSDSFRCNLNSSVLRDDATGFEITDEQGEVVLTSSF